MDGGSPAISVKWYSGNLYYPGGVNIYRQELGDGTWIKLNKSPLKKETNITPDNYEIEPELFYRYEKGDTLAVMRPLYGIDPIDYVTDTSLLLCVTLVEGMYPRQPEGVIFLHLMLKSIHSGAFAKYLGIQFDDHDVRQGKTYRYKVAALVNGKEYLTGVSDMVAAGDSQRIAPPVLTDLKGGKMSALKDSAITEYAMANISWKPEPLRYYGVNIYRSSDNLPIMKINSSPVVLSELMGDDGKYAKPEVAYEDTMLEFNRTYYYQLAGIDFFGKESYLSPRSELFTTDLRVPPAPDSIWHELDGYELRLNWAQPADRDEQVKGYNIYRSREEPLSPQKINKDLIPASLTGFTDNLPGYGGYIYQVASVNESGNEGLSYKYFVEKHDFDPPATPAGLKAVADTGVIALSWDANREEDLLGYQIFRRIRETDEFLLMNADPIPQTFFYDTLPKNVSNHFQYRLMAVDRKINRSEPSEPSNLARMPDITPPSQPFIKQVEPADKGLLIEWLPGFEPDLAGYNLYRYGAGSDTALIASVPADQMAYRDSALQPGVKYYYRLEATDSMGNASEWSNPYAGVAEHSDAAMAKPEITKLEYNDKRKEVLISWEVPGPGDYLGFVVFRNVAGMDLRPVSGKLTGNTFIDAGVAPPATLSYQVRAYRDNGQKSQSEINEITVTE